MTPEAAANWTPTRLSWVAETIVPQRDKPTDLTGDVPWVRIEDFNGKYISESHSGQGVNYDQIRSMPLRVFPPKTVVTSCSCTMGATAITTRPLITNQTFIGLVPDESRLSADFLYYLMQAKSDELQALATGAIQQYLSQDDFRSMRFALPPVSIQWRIADYLDRETAEIDAFIKDQERFKKLLLEHREATRSSVIRRAAERQGAPHVRLKFLADVTVGIVVNPSSWYVEEEGVPALRGLNVRPEEISTSELVQISQEGHIAHSKSRLEAGDVVVVRTGQAGAAAVIPEHLHDCNAIDLLIVKPGDTLSSDFLSMYINSDVARGVISAQSVGAIQAHFNVEALRNLSIPYLDLPQQLRLVATWKEESSAVELALRDVETSIQLAQERRSALISAAVTGQIDVAAQNLSAADHLRDELEVYA